MREVCALRHRVINTEKTYTGWLGRYGAFLKDPKLKGGQHFTYTWALALG